MSTSTHPTHSSPHPPFFFKNSPQYFNILPGNFLHCTDIWRSGTLLSWCSSMLLSMLGRFGFGGREVDCGTIWYDWHGASGLHWIWTAEDLEGGEVTGCTSGPIKKEGVGIAGRSGWASGRIQLSWDSIAKSMGSIRMSYTYGLYIGTSPLVSSFKYGPMIRRCGSQSILNATPSPSYGSAAGLGLSWGLCLR